MPWKDSYSETPLSQEKLDKALEKAKAAMAEGIGKKDFFPQKMVYRDKFLAAALDNTLPYPVRAHYVEEPEKREDYLPRILIQAEKKIGWCYYGMKPRLYTPITLQDQKDLLASTYQSVVDRARNDPADYLAKKGFEVFMKNLGIKISEMKYGKTLVSR